MTKKKLIIFDLDGTLVDSLDDLTTSVNHMLAIFGQDPITRDAVRGMVGQGARNLVERALPDFGAAEQQQGLEIFLQHNEQHLADMTLPYPGVVETLERLQATGYDMVVVTNKNESLSRSLLDKLGLSGFFIKVYGADSLPARKPSPEPLLHVMALLGFSNDATVMVGDSINDISAGNAAGVNTIGCTWGYGDDSELIGADYRVDTFAELLTFMD